MPNCHLVEDTSLKRAPFDYNDTHATRVSCIQALVTAFFRGPQNTRKVTMQVQVQYDATYLLNSVT